MSIIIIISRRTSSRLRGGSVMNNITALHNYQRRINKYLEHILPNTESVPNKLHEAMRYSVLNGGKRIRAILTYLSGEIVNANLNVLDSASAAVELIHAFSLIHDDLPALDNDDLRRGKLTCHKVFGVSTAILAGDALQSLAFEILARVRKQHKISSDTSLEMIEVLSHSIGAKGMACGEYLDLSMNDLTQKEQTKILEKIYKLKTSKLLFASVLLGLLAGDCHDKNILINMSRYGLYIGIAFQIHDDVLERESDTKTLGKSNTADIDNNKPTYISLADLKYAKQEEIKFYNRALDHLNKTGLPVDKIVQLSEYIIQRVH